MMGEGQERGKLASATRASLLLAERNGLVSIAFPAISTGVYGYPMEGCAQVMLKVIVDFTFEDLTSLRTILVCLYDHAAYAVFAREFTKQLEDVGGKAEE
jgi:O-acetyl-ADP-ribose deacetylase (regulator of RNase III)